MQTRAKTLSQNVAAKDIDMAEVATPEHTRSVSVSPSQTSTLVQSESDSQIYSCEINSTPGTDIDNSPSPAVSNFNTTIKASEENSSGSASTPAAAPLRTQRNSLVVTLTFRDQIIAKGVVEIGTAKGKGKRSFEEHDDVEGETPEPSTKQQKIKPTFITFEETHNGDVSSVRIQTEIVASTAVVSSLRLNEKDELVSEERLESLFSKTENLQTQSLTPAGSQTEAPPASGSEDIGDATAEAPFQDDTSDHKEKPAAAGKKRAGVAGKKLAAAKTASQRRTAGKRPAALKQAVVLTQTKAVQKKAIIRAKAPEGGWTNKYHHKLGYSGLEHAAGAGPSPEDFQTIMDILQSHHAAEKEPIDFSRSPIHASDGAMIHAVVQVIMAQSTGNDIAMTAVTSLTTNYVIENDKGEKGSGKIPDYHAIRKCDVKELEAVIREGGLSVRKSEAIKALLDSVYNWNYAKLSAEEKLTVCEGNPLEATEFIPGLLSLDYLNDFDTDQESYDHILTWRQIGMKSACCIMAFALKKDVFAVDTHVHRLSIGMGWVPKNFDADQACRHLDAIVPNHLKYGMHQGLWHHDQKCSRCLSRTSATMPGLDKCICPLEPYMKRNIGPKKRTTKKSPSSGSAADSATSSATGSPAPKAIKIKKEKTLLPYDAMTPEEAEEKGWELNATSLINDDFGTDHGNIQAKVLRRWKKKVMIAKANIKSVAIETKTITVTTVETMSTDSQDPIVDPAGTEMDD